MAHGSFYARVQIANVYRGVDLIYYSTFLGGIHANTEAPVAGQDAEYGIAVDAAGNAYVTGSTGAIDFPTVNALQPALNVAMPSGSDAFIAKLNPAGSALVYYQILDKIAWPLHFRF